MLFRVNWDSRPIQATFQKGERRIYNAYCMKETEKDILSTLIDIVVLSNRQECKFYRT